MTKEVNDIENRQVHCCGLTPERIRNPDMQGTGNRNMDILLTESLDYIFEPYSVMGQLLRGRKARLFERLDQCRGYTKHKILITYRLITVSCLKSSLHRKCSTSI